MSIKPVVDRCLHLGLAACSNETPDHDGKERASVFLLRER